MSEQSSSFLLLVALAFWVGVVTAEHFEIPKPVTCYGVTGYEYQGRDSDGRPTWEYPTRTICNEESDATAQK